MRTEKIAEALQISIATAKAHRKQIAKKLGISAREMNREAVLCWGDEQNC